MNHAPCPVVDKHGKWYPSQRAFLRASGIAMPTLQYHLNRYGNLDRVGMGNSRPGNQARAVPTRVGPHEFRSQVAAAAWLGISVHQFKRWTKPDAKPLFREMLMAACIAATARNPEPLA